MSTPAPIPDAHAVCTRYRPGGPWEVVRDEHDGRHAWPVYACPAEAEGVRLLFAKADPGGEYAVHRVAVAFRPAGAVRPKRPPRDPGRRVRLPRAALREVARRALAGEDRDALVAEFDCSRWTVARVVREAKAKGVAA